MGNRQIHRPQEKALETLLGCHTQDAVGKILRLSLWAGLTRGELLALTWDQVDFDASCLRLPDRAVPLSASLWEFLQDCDQHNTPFVVTTQRQRGPITPQGATHGLRAALNAVGEPDVRLRDLRNEYIINALQTQTPEQVCRLVGLNLLTLQANFGPYLYKTPTQPPSTAPPLPRNKLKEILRQEGDSVAGLALHLAWYGGLAVQDMAALTWDACPIALPKPPQGPADYVLVGPKSGKPLPPERISRLARQALVDGGLDQVSLRDLIGDFRQQSQAEPQVLALLSDLGHASTATLAQTLGVPKRTMYRQLQRLCQQNCVVKVGALYYLPETVVAPQDQMALVEAHLETYGVMYRKDVVELLKITPNQGSVLLRKWVGQGLLCQEGQTYRKG